jgi:hypothetical protein
MTTGAWGGKREGGASFRCVNAGGKRDFQIGDLKCDAANLKNRTSNYLKFQI